LSVKRHFPHLMRPRCSRFTWVFSDGYFFGFLRLFPPRLFPTTERSSAVSFTVSRCPPPFPPAVCFPFFIPFPASAPSAPGPMCDLFGRVLCLVGPPCRFFFFQPPPGPPYFVTVSAFNTVLTLPIWRLLFSPPTFLGCAPDVFLCRFPPCSLSLLFPQYPTLSWMVASSPFSLQRPCKFFWVFWDPTNTTKKTKHKKTKNQTPQTKKKHKQTNKKNNKKHIWLGF